MAADLKRLKEAAGQDAGRNEGIPVPASIEEAKGPSNPKQDAVMSFSPPKQQKQSAGAK